MSYQKIASKFNVASQVSAIVLVAAIPFSVFAVNIFFHGAILCNIFAGNLREKFNFIVRNPAALMFIIFFLMSLIGLIYTTVPLVDALPMFNKYSKYLLAVMLFPVFTETKWRNYAIIVFVGSVSLLMAISYLRYFGYFAWAMTGSVEVFKNHIDFNFLMAFASYLCLLQASLTQRFYRLLWIVFFIFLAVTVLFWSEGRTGYLVFVGLILLFFIQKSRWRGVVIALNVMALFFSLAFLFSTTFKNRINEAISNVETYHSSNNTSVGLRITFAINSLELIKAHPVFGTGTGSYIKEYKNIKSVPQGVRPNHNEYIHIIGQFGMVGFIVLMLFFLVPFRYSKFLPERERYIARGIIISMMLSALVNAALSDHVPRYCYIYFMTLAFASLGTRFKLQTTSRKCTNTKSGNT